MKLIGSERDRDKTHGRRSEMSSEEPLTSSLRGERTGRLALLDQMSPERNLGPRCVGW
jgi:hypothetical protein